jgi:hypothetical protein
MISLSIVIGDRMLKFALKLQISDEKTSPAFYERNDAMQIAKDLLGKIVEITIVGIIASGIIV